MLIAWIKRRLMLDLAGNEFRTLGRWVVLIEIRDHAAKHRSHERSSEAPSGLANVAAS